MSKIFKRILKAFEIDAPYVTPKPKKPRKEVPSVATPEIPLYIQEQIERAELEAEAYYILTMQGHTCPGVVRYTSNIELIQLIHSSKYANYKINPKK